jgi:hypothetical protein
MYGFPPAAAWLATPAVTAIVADRIYAIRAPQDTQAPYITWQPVVAEERPTLDVPQHDLARTLVQVECWALSYQQAAQLAAAVRDAVRQHLVVDQVRVTVDADTDLVRAIVEGVVVMQ